MSQGTRENRPVSEGVTSLAVSDLSELLRLLAFTRERAEAAYHELAEARDRADREVAAADALRAELTGMTATVAELEGRILVAEEDRRGAEALAHERADQLASALEGAASAQQATLETRAERDGLQAQLDDVLRSTSWRMTAPVRSVTGRLERGSAPSSGGR